MAILTNYESLPSDRVYEIGNTSFVGPARGAQSFQISLLSQVTGSRMYMARNTGSAEIQVRIETDNAGSPSGTLAHANALATLQQADIPVSDAYVSVSFAAFYLQPNTTYWLVLQRTVEPGPTFSTYYWDAKQNPPNYDIGVAKYYNGSWNQFSGQDLIFEISGTPAPVFTINLGSFALADNPNGIAIEDINFQIAKNIEESALPKGDGAVIPIGSRKDIVAKVKGTLVGSFYADARTKMDAFLNIIESASEQKLTVDNERYLLVQYRNFAESYRSKNNFIDFSFDVVASYPFWLTNALQRSTLAWTTGNLFKITNNGNAKTRAKIILTAVGGTITDDIKLENLSTGEVVQYRGTLNAGKILTINNRVNSALVKLGTGSLALYGTDYLSTPDSADWDFGAGDFTIDCWVYFNSLITNGTIYSKRAAGGNLDNFVIAQVGTDILVAASSNGTTFDILNSVSFGASLVTGQSYHIAVVRSGNNFYGFLNGVKVTLGSSAAIIKANSQNVRIGGDSDASWVNGYIDEFRISKGIARWTANFTPATSEYVVDTNTKLLLHMNGNPKATTFLDVSSAMHIMTVSGNARVQNDLFLDSGEVLNAGTSDITNLNGDFLTLAPGDNYIKLTCGQSAAILSIEYREAYK